MSNSETPAAPQEPTSEAPTDSGGNVDEKFAARLGVKVAMIGAIAALFGSVIGGITSVVVGNAAYSNQVEQQAAEFTHDRLKSSQDQRKDAYKAWIKAEPSAIAAAGGSQFCLWKNDGDRNKCDSDLRNFFEKFKPLSDAAIDVDIFGSQKSVDIDKRYQEILTSYGQTALEPNGKTSVSLRNQLFDLRDQFLLRACAEISADPRLSCLTSTWTMPTDWSIAP